MYEEFFGHFGLQRNPFHVSPDPKTYYSTPVHDEALSQLVFGIEARQGLMVLTGEPGTGKSTILHYLMEWLRKQNYSTAYIFQTLVPSLDLLWLISRDFGVACDSMRKSDLLLAIKDWLMARHHAGDCPVIIIDEAQGLNSRGLDELRMLLNLEFPGGKLVQLVLAGQPQLEEKLNWRKLAQLRQRIMLHSKLRPLTPEEAAGFIRTRLSGAGGGRSVVFPQETVNDIYGYSKGVPRVIHLLCEHALLATYADRRECVTPSDILRVAKQFELVPMTEEEADAFHSDTFCRLIPFPRLNTEAERPMHLTPKQPVDPEVSALESLVDLAAAPAAPAIPVAAKWPADSEITAIESLVDVATGPTEPAIHVAPKWATKPTVEAILPLTDVAVRAAEPAVPVVPKWPTKPALDAIVPPMDVAPAASTAASAIPAMPKKSPVTELPKAKAEVPTTVSAARSPRVSLSPARPAVPATKISAPKPTVAEPPPSAGFVAYWRAVGDSLRHDVQQLLEPFALWRRIPTNANVSPSPRATITSISKWLRLPFRSPHIPDRISVSDARRRVSSAAPKRF